MGFFGRNSQHTSFLRSMCTVIDLTFSRARRNRRGCCMAVHHACMHCLATPPMDNLHYTVKHLNFFDTIRAQICCGLFEEQCTVCLQCADFCFSVCAWSLMFHCSPDPLQSLQIWCVGKETDDLYLGRCPFEDLLLIHLPLFPCVASFQCIIHTTKHLPKQD